MIKHVAKLHELRPAHDTLGVLKTAVMPKPLRDVSMAEDAKESLEYKYYLTPTWDELVPFPTSKRFLGSLSVSCKGPFC